MTVVIRSFYILFICITTILAQSPTISLIDNINDYTNFGYTDCWGYTDTEGNQYTLLGVNQGVSILDLSDLENIYEVEFVDWIRQGWYDIKTYRDSIL